MAGIERKTLARGTRSGNWGPFAFHHSKMSVFGAGLEVVRNKFSCARILFCLSSFAEIVEVEGSETVAGDLGFQMST